jgi:hypothetical protein
MDSLPSGLGERKFTKLSDGIMKRKYIIAEIYLQTGQRFNVIEIEREQHSLSTLILYSSHSIDWNKIYAKVLFDLVQDSGAWSSKSLKGIEKLGATIKKAKHSSKTVDARVISLFKKLQT